MAQMHDFAIDQYVGSRFQALVEQSPLITYTHGLDESQPLTYISPQVESILGTHRARSGRPTPLPDVPDSPRGHHSR